MATTDDIHFDSIEDAIEALRRGEPVVVMDDEDRENEGDLILPAVHATPERIAFILANTTGILCAAIPASRAKQLDLPQMVDHNTCPKGTAFTVSIDARERTTTGVSAWDRSVTFQAIANGSVGPEAFVRPGHVFPVQARDGGVLVRRGHTEASVDLCRLAGFEPPVAVICEMMDKETGTMKRLKACSDFVREHGLKLTTVEALAEWRRRHDAPLQLTPAKHKVELVSECTVPIEREGRFLGKWRLLVFKDDDKHREQHQHIVALVRGELDHATDVLARVHSECFTGNTIGSVRCDCGEQFNRSLAMIDQEGRGIMLYVQGHEGRGIGLVNKIKAYQLQTTDKLDTYRANEALGLPTDQRMYDASRAVMEYLGIKSIKLLTNNPAKVEAFRDMCSSVIPLVCAANEHNEEYLKAKRRVQLNVSHESHGKDRAAADLQLPAVVAAPTVASLIGKHEQQYNSYAPPVGGCAMESTHHGKEMPLTIPDNLDTSRIRIGIVRTCWNESLVGPLTEGCRNAILSTGVPIKNVTEISVPGSFELPFAALTLAQSGKVDAVVAIGVLIKGETAHFEYISSATSSGLMKVGLKTGVPTLYGVLNCFDTKQAEARCLPPSQLPTSLGLSAVKMAALKTGTA